MAPERDRVAVQLAERPGRYAGVETAGLPSGKDLGRDGVTGFAQAGAEAGGREGHGGAHSAHLADAGQRRGRYSRTAAGDGELAGQARLPLLVDGVLERGGAE
jgi:hypothetical protein